MLTKNKHDLSAAVDKLSKANADLSLKLSNGGGGSGGGGGDGATCGKFPSSKRNKPAKCAHCGRVVMHKDEDCYKLAKNAHLRPKNFRSVKEE